MSDFSCFAWRTKSMIDNSPKGYIHAATIDAKITACGLEPNEKWWFSDVLYENLKVNCPRCLERIRPKMDCTMAKKEEEINDYFIRCDCGSEGIMFRRILDHPDDEYPLFFISFWQEGFRDRSIKEKIRAIKYILKNGEPYCDQIVLNKDSLAQLRDICNNMLGEKKI